MTPPPPNLQARAAAIAPLRRRGHQLLGRFLRRSRAVAVPRAEVSSDPFLEVGRRLRVARESRGLSLRQLAQETRISITVLEALEKGWRDRLPEPAYLRTMLALLEQHLAFEQGCLEAALPASSTRRLRSNRQAHPARVPLTSIALFATLQGAVLYGVACLLLIYGLNRQQQRLVVQGLLPLQTVPARPSLPSESPGAGARERARVVAAYPELWPLERARRGQGLLLLRRQDAGSSAPPDASPGESTETAADGAGARAGRPGPQDPVAAPPRP